MEASNELLVEAQDEREWELSDEELDRIDVRYCPGRSIG